MRKFIRYLIIAPLALIFVALAVANREMVELSLDPFALFDPPLALRMPLFLLVILSILVGVVAGGFAAWLRQGKWRRAARENGSEAELWRAEADRLRRGKGETGPPALPSPRS